MKTWNELIDPIVQKCKLSSTFNMDTVFHKDGAIALSQLLQKMATIIDEEIERRKENTSMKVFINVKHDDRADIQITTENAVVLDYVGSMPYLNNILGGDYTQLTIDNETGTIIGWEPIKQEDIDEFISSESIIK